MGQAVRRAALYEAERDGRLALEQANATVERLLAQARVEADRLRESEQRFQSLSDDSPLLVWTADTDGRFLWANTTFCAFLGLPRREVQASSWRTWLHPDDVEAFLGQLSGAGLGAPGVPATARARRADGQWRWMESWANRRADPAPATATLLGTSVDVTDRHQADQVLRSAAQLQDLRLRLADAFARSKSTIELHSHAAHILGRQLAASRVHWADVDATEQYGVVRTGYHEPTLDSVVGFHRLSDHPPDVVADLRKGRALVVHDVASDPRVTPARQAVAQALSVGAYVIEPVVRANHIMAALFVHRRAPHRWDDDELAAIAETAARTWAAVEDLRSTLAAQQHHAREELALRALEGVTGGGDVGARLQRLVDVLAPALGDFALVAVPNASERGTVIAVAPARDGASGDRDQVVPSPREALSDVAVARSVERATAGRPTLLSLITPAVRASYGADPRDRSPAPLHTTRSLVAVPLDLGAGRGGALVIGLTAASSHRDPYSSEDLGYAEQLARRVSIALATALGCDRARNCGHPAKGPPARPYPARPPARDRSPLPRRLRRVGGGWRLVRHVPMARRHDGRDGGRRGRPQPPVGRGDGPAARGDLSPRRRRGRRTCGPVGRVGPFRPRAGRHRLRDGGVCGRQPGDGRTVLQLRRASAAARRAPRRHRRSAHPCPVTPARRRRHASAPAGAGNAAARLLGRAVLRWVGRAASGRSRRGDRPSGARAPDAPP
ncbi:MAG: PAS domain S-box protein [Alphaproteobacteria bacterium]